MSRYTETPVVHGKRYEVAYGYDHACGWYIQVWYPGDSADAGDAPAIDLDTLFNGLTVARLMRIAAAHGCGMHIRNLAGE